MTLLTELRSEFYDDKSLYDIIKTIRYDKDLNVDLRLMQKLLDFNWNGKPNGKFELKDRWSKILEIDDYVFGYCHDCDTLEYDEDMVP